MTLIILFLISVLISAFGTLIGFGGGVFLVPILIVFFQFPYQVAVSSVMAALVPGSLISTYFNHRNHLVDYRAGTILEIPTIIGTIVGALLVSIVPVNYLLMIFTLFLSLLGINFLHSPQARTDKNWVDKINALPPAIILKNSHQKVAYRMGVSLVTGFGLLAGTLAGLFGVGGGFMKAPIMIKVFKIPAKIAAATSLFMISITSLTGTISHYALGHFDLTQAVPIILGFMVGALLGGRLNIGLSEKFVGKLIGAGLILSAVAIIVKIIFLP